MKCFKLYSISLFFLLLTTVQSAFPELRYKGFLDHCQAVRLNEPNDYLSSRTRLRAEIDGYSGLSSWFTSANFENNEILENRNGLTFREAWVAYNGDNIDLRIGRQIIIWGKADGMQVLDVVSPQDLTEFLARDYDDIRLPVSAVRGKIIGTNATLELVWLPFFESSILPSGDNPWAVSYGFTDNDEIRVDDTKAPGNELGNSEFGGRVSFYLSGLDMAFYAFRSWNDAPVSSILETGSTVSGGDSLTITPQHHRFTMLGFDLSKPWNDFVLRSEVGYFIGRRWMSDANDGNLYNKTSLLGVLGVDYYAGSDWSLTAQISDRFIPGHERGMANDEHESMATLSVSKAFFRQVLNLSSFTYYGINKGDAFVRIAADYALTDDMHLATGLDIFAGDEGDFAYYKDNNEIWIKAKYSF